MRIVLLVGSLLLASGCVVHTRSPRPAPEHPPPPPPRPVAMSRDEAVDLGFRQCRSRGYECRLKDVDRKGRDRWEVEFFASSRNRRGKVEFEFDAWSRRLIDVDEKMKERRDWDDDDWDDHGHGHGHGRGKKRGHARHDD
ncbi:hypothetical protein LY474_35810 [Myxococcus stipitatus]|uniref:hypothetical protein n=1 Tax=Myxococcus stipitatus TaxID=83455 RepID=UPI001F1BF607|nr:hypothetical protein [Myxococcus stipitatus]MCE9673187.1 hypothetical protein [Myxococcus stipitatus]